MNIFLDHIFVARLHMGIVGAGLATVLGLVLSCIIGVFYFGVKAKNLRFTVKKLHILPGLRCMVNGSSECIDQYYYVSAVFVYWYIFWIFNGYISFIKLFVWRRKERDTL